MKQEAAELSDDDLKQAVEEISNFHKSGIFRCPTVDKVINLWHERSKIPFKNTREFVSGAEKIVLLEAAQRWMASLDKWSPIEEAPPGIDVLILREYGYMQVAMKSEDQMLCIHGYPVSKPTHFQPLPKPPKKKT